MRNAAPPVGTSAQQVEAIERLLQQGFALPRPETG